MKPKSNRRKLVGIILAGGRGTRLFGSLGGSKALFPLDGRPLIEYSLLALAEAKIKDIAILSRIDDLALRLAYDNLLHLPDPGIGTLPAVRAAAEYAIANDAEAVISSCDLVCRSDAAAILVSTLHDHHSWLAAVGTTPIANDHTPIWVHADHGCRVTDYGKNIQPSRAAFASIRAARLEFLSLLTSSTPTLPTTVTTDTQLMRHLILSVGVEVGAVGIGPSIDVDDASDVRHAALITGQM